MQLVHPEDRAYRDQVNETIRREGEAEFEYRVLRPDGEVRHVTGYGRLVRDEAGEAVAMFGATLDTTELRQKERDLQEKNAELQRFTYTISHDLKSPLVTVKTFLGYLEEDMSRSDAGRIEQDIGYMRTAAEKMGQLLDELLEMSRIGRVANPPVRVKFRELVDEALGIVAGRIVERGVEVRVDEAAVTLVGERPRLVEIWQNLVENAVKFMGDQASPRIDIGVEGRGRQAVFFVRDNGMGVDPRY
jgi:light-regulated signal transduction histidine kinase (bacteriophytochrome)